MDSNTKLTQQQLDKYIDVFTSTKLPRLQKLERYYLSKNDAITNRTFEDKSKPNAKIAHSYASYITDNISSYFMGEPIILNSKNKDMLLEYSAIFEYNDAQASDTSIARDMSIFGVGYEVTYMDKDKNIRFDRLNPMQTFVIYDNTLEQNVLYGIRFYDIEDIVTNEISTSIEVYTDSEIIYYTKTKAGITLMDSTAHYFKQVPISVYQNNDYCIGDFENVIPLIDAYDFAVSDTSNALDYFNDAYLLFINSSLDERDIQQMKENRVIALDGQDGATVDARWLVKNNTDIEQENYKNKLVSEIHKLSKMPDLSETMGKSHISAEAVRMSLLATEQLVAVKEGMFKKGKQKTLEIITTILNMLGEKYDYRDIDITFTRNIPQSLVGWADVISKLRGVISDETLLSQLPFVTDVQIELGRLEKQNSMNSYANFMNDDIEEVDTYEQE